MDSNSYPDLVVGSPLSNSIIVLRTRPIYKIKAYITNRTAQAIQNIQDHQTDCMFKQDRQDKSCINLEICFEIDENIQLPGDKSKMNFNLEADILMPNPRVFFTITNNRVFNDSLRIDQRTTCHMSLELEIKNEISDLITPVEFKLMYAFANDLSSPLRSNLKNINDRPMVHPESQQLRFTVLFYIIVYSLMTITLKINILKADFKKECGTDNACITDLIINAKFLNLTIG